MEKQKQRIHREMNGNKGSVMFVEGLGYIMDEILSIKLLLSQTARIFFLFSVYD